MNTSDAIIILINQLRNALGNGLTRALEAFKNCDISKHVSMSDIERRMMLAWYYEEIDQNEFTMSDAINWMKEHLDNSIHSAGAIFKIKSEDMPDSNMEKVVKNLHSAQHISSVREGGNIDVHLFFLDKDGQPLLGLGDRHKVVHAAHIDDSLNKNFGEKDLIILK